ncbi:MAG: hypothetical protein LBQ20_00920 [Rhodanobacter sp.]|nr:hypothetical protein [Rhodanobacter sp.]
MSLVAIRRMGKNRKMLKRPIVHVRFPIRAAISTHGLHTFGMPLAFVFRPVDLARPPAEVDNTYRRKIANKL